MDWVQEHCDNLRSKLQSVLDGNESSGQDLGARTGLRVPWSWVCRCAMDGQGGRALVLCKCYNSAISNSNSRMLLVLVRWCWCWCCRTPRPFLALDGRLAYSIRDYVCRPWLVAAVRIPHTAENRILPSDKKFKLPMMSKSLHPAITSCTSTADKLQRFVWRNPDLSSRPSGDTPPD